MAKKQDTFVPELDGKGRVMCPVDAKILRQINTNTRNTAFADALKLALSKSGPDVKLTGPAGSK